MSGVPTNLLACFALPRLSSHLILLSRFASLFLFLYLCFHSPFPFHHFLDICSLPHFSLCPFASLRFSSLLLLSFAYVQCSANLSNKRFFHFPILASSGLGGEVARDTGTFGTELMVVYIIARVCEKANERASERERERWKSQHEVMMYRKKQRTKRRKESKVKREEGASTKREERVKRCCCCWCCCCWCCCCC